MSWLFSRALVAEFSGGVSSAGTLSAPSSLTPTQQAYLWRDRTTDTWPHFPSGMTCEHLTDGFGETVLTSYLAASHVKTSASQGREQDSMVSEVGSGASSPASFARYDRGTSSWRTVQHSPSEDSTEFSGTWPRWGSMRNGECSALAPLARHTHDKDCSLLPTPTASQAKRGWGLGSGRARYGVAAVEMVQRDISNSGWKLEPLAHAWLMGFPLGWTNLEPLETHKFQQWLALHGKR